MFKLKWTVEIEKDGLPFAKTDINYSGLDYKGITLIEGKLLGALEELQKVSEEKTK